MKKELNLGCGTGCTTAPGKFLILGYRRQDGAGQPRGRHCVFQRNCCRQEGLLLRQGHGSQAGLAGHILPAPGRVRGDAGVLGTRTPLQHHIQYRHSHEPGHRLPKSSLGMIHLTQCSSTVCLLAPSRSRGTHRSVDAVSAVSPASYASCPADCDLVRY